MRFDENFLDEIKARTRVSDIVGRHVKLKRQGREFAGLSPFTNEKTPSFFVNDEKGFYHCFSSGKHGDSISFMMEVEGLAFPEAVERLAGIAGVPMPAKDPDAARKAARSKKLVSWTEEAQHFFAASLKRDMGIDARRYLQGRGLGPEDWARYGIGFAPDSFDALRDHLLQKGAPMADLISTGLLIEPEDRNRQPWDRFRNRIMFPISDARGRLIAFGGRAMSKDQKAKYLNSPESPLFHKGSVLYRYPEARKALSDPKNPARGLIVAEGYMDVIALSRAGFDHAVAPLGTALTEDQLDLLWRAGPEPILCFDGDRAGLGAAYRSLERALPKLRPGQTLRYAMLPTGLDPDDLIREKGARAMAEVLEAAIPLVDMLWRREAEREELSTPEAKAGLKDRIFSALREISHEGVREQYQTALLAKFDAAYGRGAGRKPYSKGGSQWRRKGAPPPSSSLKAKMGRMSETGAGRMPREKRLMGAILRHPELLARVDEIFFELKFDTPAMAALQKAVLSYLREGKPVDKSAIRAHIEDQGLAAELKLFSAFGNASAALALAGPDSDAAVLEAEWLREAAIHQEFDVAETQRAEFRDRMNAVIRDGDRETMLKLMRRATVTK